MTSFATEIEIAAPAQRVWAVMMDVERWHEWTASIGKIDKLDAGPLRVGNRARIFQPKLRPNVWEVTELDEPNNFTWITRSAGITVTASHVVTPVNGGSRVRLQLVYSGLLAPLVARMFRDLNERYLGMEAQGLKKRSESA